MSYTISLVLGDWSHDGHSKSDTVNIDSNLTKAEVEKAYKAGTKKLGFDLVNDVCSDYEDNKLSNEQWQKLKSLGYPEDKIPGDVYREDEEDGPISVWNEGFVDMYLFIVKLGNSKFEGKVLEEKDNPTIYIGGYGLYY